MINRYLIVLVVSPSLAAGCVSQFTPEIDEKTNMLVVEGMITDQNMANRIKVSRSIPVGQAIVAKPLKGCDITITDECDIIYNLKEISAGIYVTDSTKFRGPSGKCFFYRWDFTETWEINLHFQGLNPICWITRESDEILIKSTKEYGQPKVD